MLYREMIAVCSEIHTKHINTVCRQNVEFLNIKPAGTYQKHLVLKGLSNWDRRTAVVLTNIILYILLELRIKSIYFELAVNGSMFAERIY
jgi:hypothetical protein